MDIANAPLISLIVPVYNGERFLRACVESVLAQTCSAWELVLVDDGSSDGTAALADGFAAADARIRVFHRENGGVSAARNTGLDAVRGEFVAFLDADDVLPETSLETRLALIEDADMALSRYGEFSEADGVLFEMPEVRTSSWTRREAVLGSACSGELHYQGFLFNRLFRARIIAAHGLRFDEGIAYNEDRLFCTAYALFCERVALGNDLVYWYRRSDTSAMGALAGITDEKAARVMTEFSAYERIIALVEPEYPEFVAFVAADALYRAVKVNKLAAPEARALHAALGEQMVKFGSIALGAEDCRLPFRQRVKMRIHMLLKR
mgnify:CR=1 FL=1